jgi:ABC-type lipoprotein release transport system permease subunit
MPSPRSFDDHLQLYSAFALAVLGSPSTRVMALIIRDGIQTTTIGVAFGLALALAGGHLLSALRYEVSPYDPAVLGGVATLMLITALLSCGAPAVRATRADPATVFRAE